MNLFRSFLIVVIIANKYKWKFKVLKIIKTLFLTELKQINNKVSSYIYIYIYIKFFKKIKKFNSHVLTVFSTLTN